MKRFLKGKSLPVFLILLVVLMSVVALAVANFSVKKTELISNTSSNNNSIHLDDNGKATPGEYISKSSSEILSELQKAQVNVTDKVSSFVSFNYGAKGSSGSWTVENLASNNVIMQCEIFVSNNLYAKSVPIYPNEHIESITLLNDLKSGIYDAVAYINYYKLDTKEYISKAGYKIKLIVQ